MTFPKGRLRIERQIEELRAENEQVIKDCTQAIDSADRYLEKAARDRDEPLVLYRGFVDLAR